MVPAANANATIPRTPPDRGAARWLLVSCVVPPLVATDYNAIVTAMSGALADLCREIASAIAEQPRAAV